MKSPMVSRMKQLTVRAEKKTPWYLDLLGILTVGLVGYCLTILIFCL